MPSNTHTVIGGSKRFECRVMGHPPPDIRWFKDGRDITRSDRYNFDYSKSDGVISMVIDNISHKDQGNYRCRAENTEGFASTSAYLLVRAHKEHPDEEIEEVHAMELEECFVYKSDNAHTISTEFYREESDSDAARKRTFEEIVDEEKENSLEGRYKLGGKDFSGKKSGESAALSELNATEEAYSRQQVDESEETQEARYKKKKTVVEEYSSKSASQVAVKAEHESLVESESSMKKSAKATTESRSESSFAAKMETEAVSTSSKKSEESSFYASSSVEESSLKARKESKGSEMVLGVSVETEESSSLYSKSKSGKTLVASIETEESASKVEQKTKSAEVTEMEVTSKTSKETSGKAATKESERSLITSIETEEKSVESTRSAMSAEVTSTSITESQEQQRSKITTDASVEESKREEVPEECRMEPQDLNEVDGLGDLSQSMTESALTSLCNDSGFVETSLMESSQLQVDESIVESVVEESSKETSSFDTAKVSTEEEKEMDRKLQTVRKESYVEESQVTQIVEEAASVKQTELSQAVEKMDTDASKDTSKAKVIQEAYQTEEISEDSSANISELESESKSSKQVTEKTEVKEESVKTETVSVSQEESHAEQTTQETSSGDITGLLDETNEQTTVVEEQAAAVEEDLEHRARWVDQITSRADTITMEGERKEVAELKTSEDAAVTAESSEKKDDSSQLGTADVSVEESRVQPLDSQGAEEVSKLSDAEKTSAEISEADAKAKASKEEVEESSVDPLSVTTASESEVDDISVSGNEAAELIESEAKSDLVESSTVAVSEETSKQAEENGLTITADIDTEETKAASRKEEELKVSAEVDVAEKKETDKLQASAEVDVTDGAAKAAPRIVSVPDDVSIELGETIHLTSQVQGNPQPEVKWFKEGDTVKAGERITLRTENDVFTLEIREAASEDAGTYTLTAHNSEGTIFSDVLVTVNIPPSIGPSDEELRVTARLTIPEFVAQPGNVTVRELGTLELVCTIKANPSPTVSWSKDGKPLQADSHMRIFESEGQYYLEIPQASMDDAGDYTCTASNSEGSVSCTISAFVESRESSVSTTEEGAAAMVPLGQRESSSDDLFLRVYEVIRAYQDADTKVVLIVGDIVEVLDSRQKNGMWLVRSQVSRDQVCFIPSTHLREVGEADTGAATVKKRETKPARSPTNRLSSSELDWIDTSEDEDRTRLRENYPAYVVIADYSPQQVNGETGEQIRLTEGQIVEVMDMERADRWLVQTRPTKTCTAKQGWVPSAYLEAKTTSAPMVRRSTREVFREDVLQISNKQQEALLKRRYAVTELVESEREYVRELQKVMDSYYKRIGRRSGTPAVLKDKRDLIFSNISDILDFHKDVFLRVMEASVANPGTIGDSFLIKEKKFNMYSTYWTDHLSSSVFIETEEAQEFLKEYSRSIGDSEVTFLRLLESPINRLKTYQTLLKDILRYTARAGDDCSSLERAIAMLASIELQVKHNQLLQNIEGLPGDVSSLGQLVRHDDMIMWDSEVTQTSRAKERHVFLFKDKAVISKKKKGDSATDQPSFTFKSQVELQNIQVNENVLEDERRFEFWYATATTEKLTFQAKNVPTKQAWLKDTRELLKALGVEETDIMPERSVEVTSTHSSTSSTTQKKKVTEKTTTVIAESGSDSDRTLTDDYASLSSYESDISSYHTAQEFEDGSTRPVFKRRPKKTVCQGKLVLEGGMKYRKEPEPEPVVEEKKAEPEPVVEEKKEPQPEPVEEKKEPEPEPVVEEKKEPEPVEEKKEPEAVVEEKKEPEPEPVVEEKKEPEPEPVVEEKKEPEPEPVVEEKKEPEPESVQEKKEPEPVVEEKKKPEPVVEEQKEPEPVEEKKEPETVVEEKKEPEPEPVLEEKKEPEPEPVEEKKEPEPVVEEKKEPEPEPVPEEKKESEPEPVVEEKKESEPEPVVEEKKEPAPAVEEKEPEPEPVAEEKKEPEPEPVVEEKKEPAPAVEEKEPEPEPVVEEKKEPEPVVEEKKEPEPEPVVEEKEEPAPVVEEKKEPEAKLLVEEKKEPEPVVEKKKEPEPEPVVEKKKEPEPEPVVEKKESEPEPVVEKKKEPEPEPVVEKKKEPEPEPVVEKKEPEPEPVVEKKKEPEPEPVVEKKKEPEPEPGVEKNKAPEPVQERKEPAPVVQEKNTPEPEPVVEEEKPAQLLDRVDGVKPPEPEPPVSKSETPVVEASVAPGETVTQEQPEESQFKPIPESTPEGEIPIRPPHFLAEMNDVAVELGQLARFDCRVAAYPDPVITWLKDGNKVVPTDRYVLQNFHDDIFSLLIKDVKPEDSGRYTCHAINEYGEAKTEALLNVLALQADLDKADMAPSFATKFGNVECVEGVPVEFTCQIRGRPPPTITWLINGKEVTPSLEILTRQQEDTIMLAFRSVQLEHSGDVVCKLKNHLGEATCRAKLRVNEDLSKKGECPLFVEQPSDMEVMEGGEARFECVVTGTPDPEVIWYFNGRELFDSRRRVIRKKGNKYTLILREVIPDNAGVYTCKAVNAAGDASCAVELSVKEIPKEPAREAEEATYTFPPTFTRRLLDQRVPPGRTARFECLMLGLPLPDVEWRKDGQTLKPSDKYRIGREGSTAILEIDSAEPEDAGEYTCILVNDSGKATSRAGLTVQEERKLRGYPSPKLEARKPEIGRAPSKGREEYLPPTVRPTRELSPEEKVPSLPFDKPSLLDVRDDSVKLSWLPARTSGLPENARHVTYTVEARELPSNRWTRLASGIESNYHVARNLRPDREYMFRVYAENKYGPSDPTLPATLNARKVSEEKRKMQLLRESPAPLQFPSTRPYVMDIGAETLRLGWRPAEMERRSRDVTPVSYRVEAQKLPSEEWVPLASRVRDTSLYLSDLEPDRDYNVRVRAQGPYGVSQPTEPVWLPRAAGFTGVPVTRPQITELEPDTVRLQWRRVDVPTFTHEQDPLLYMIEMQEPPSSHWLDQIEVYDYEPEYGTVGLQWRRVEIPPFDSEEEPLLYMIECQEPQADAWRPLVSGVPTTRYRVPDISPTQDYRDTSYQLSGIKPTKDYSFRIRALTDSGLTEPTSPVTVSTLPVRPRMPPKEPVISQMGSDSVRLQWQRAELPYYHRQMAPITYAVEMQEMPGYSWTPVRRGIPETTYTVTGLRADKDYRFRIRPETDYGPGEYSPAVHAYRRPAVTLPSREPMISEVGPNSITLDWLPAKLPSGVSTARPVSYRIEMREPPTGNWMMVADRVPSTSYTINFLNPDRDYLFRVFAELDGVESEPTSTAFLPHRMGPPKMLREPPLISSVHPDSVWLSWRSVDIPARITDYAPVTYRIEAQEPPHSEWRPVARHIPQTHYHLTGLRPGQEYNFRIRAENAFEWMPLARRVVGTNYYVTGLSPDNNYAFRIQAENDFGTSMPTNPARMPRLAEIPAPIYSPEIEQIEPSALRLAWRTPKTGPYKSKKTTYAIETLEPSTWTWRPLVSNLPTPSYRVSTLSPTQDYVFRIRAEADKHLSEPSFPVTYSRTRAPPSVPVERPILSETETDSVHVSWHPVFIPTGRTGGSRRYRLEMREVPYGSWHPVLTSTTKLSHEVTGLRPNMDYSFRVSLITDEGTSPPSNAAYLYRRPVIPRLPLETPELADVTDDAVSLRWRRVDVPPFENDEEPLSFMIESQRLPSYDWEPVARGITDTSYRIRDLQPREDYVFRVRGEMPSGITTPSVPVPLYRRPERAGVPISYVTSDDRNVPPYSARLRWKPVYIPPFTSPSSASYLIEMQEPPRRDWRPLASDVRSTDYLVSDLSPRKSYMFRVRAKSPAGVVSEPSMPVPFYPLYARTLAGQPRPDFVMPVEEFSLPDRPYISTLIVKVPPRMHIEKPDMVQTSPTSVHLTWNAARVPATTSSLSPTTYRVEVREDGTFNWVERASNIVGLGCDITGLDPRLDYAFRVRAVNDFGWSEATLPAFLHRPLDLINYDEPEIDWDSFSPTAYARKAPITYIVEMKEPSDRAWSPVASRLQDTSFQVSGLQPVKPYLFRVRAESEYGSSEPTLPAELSRTKLPPRVPTGRPAISDIKETSCTLSWPAARLPAYLKNTKVDYIVEFRETDSRLWANLAENVPETTYKVTGLDPERDYMFRVRSHNEAGTSEPTLPATLERPKKKAPTPQRRGSSVERRSLDRRSMDRMSVERRSMSRQSLERRSESRLSRKDGSKKEVEDETLPGMAPDDTQNSLLIKTIQALAFVPPDDVIEAFQQPMDSLDGDTDKTLSDFLAYFESTWLGIVQRGRRRRPKFDVAMWNVYNRVEDNLPRTNNSVEGWHRAFDQRMSVTHPTLARLVSKLRKEQASTELMIEQHAMGVRMRKNKQYKVVNTRLQALVASVGKDDVQFGVESHPMTISLQLRGYPPPQVTWYHQGKKLALGDRYDTYVTPTGQVFLEFLNMGWQDVGNYKCVAENELGTAEKTVKVDVADPPTFIEPLRDINVVDRGTATLTCAVDGIPYPSVRFMRDWRPLTDTSRLVVANDPDQPESVSPGFKDGCLEDNYYVLEEIGRDAADKEFFRSELDMLQKQKHKNIVSVHDAYETPRQLIIVTELLPGGELLDRVVSYGNWTEGKAAGVVKQLLETLQHVHSSGVIHLDIKPSNLLLSGDSLDSTKLIDFGERPTVDECLAHPWLKKTDGGSKIDVSIIKSFQDRDKAQMTGTDAAEKALRPALDPKTGAVSFPDTEAYGEFLDSESWYEWQSRYGQGPDSGLLPLKDPEYTVRVRGYRRSAGSVDDSSAPLDVDEEISAAERERYKMMKERRLMADIDKEEIPPSLEKELQWLEERKQARKAREPQRQDSVDSRRSSVSGDTDGVRDRGPIPVFRQRLQDLSFETGDTITMYCALEGPPPYSTVWYKNEELLSDGSRVKQELSEDGQATLTITAAKPYDAGVYKYVPERPGRPVVLELGSEEAILIWESPRSDGNCPIMYYRVDFKARGDSRWTTAVYTPLETCLVCGLKPGTSYRFRVSATNLLGRGPFSWSTVEVTTKKQGSVKGVLLGGVNLDVLKARQEEGKQTASKQRDTEPAEEPAPIDTTEPILQTSAIDTEYVVGGALWKGKFGELKECTSKKTSKHCLVKVVPASVEDRLREFNILKSLRHETIVLLLSAFNTDSALYLVFEGLPGEHVMQRLSLRRRYSEDNVAYIIRQVLYALQYLHRNNLVHLNLQPASLLLTGPRGLDIKLTDFSLAQALPAPEGMAVPRKGYPDFIAPEVVVKEKVTLAADVWGVGTLTFLLLSGMSPFSGATDEETLINVAYSRYDAGDLLDGVSNESLRFLFKVMKRLPRNRPTVQDCLEHKWLQMTDAMMKTRESNLFLSNRLRNFVLGYDLRRQSDDLRMTFDDLVLPAELVTTLQPDVLTADTKDSEAAEVTETAAAKTAADGASELTKSVSFSEDDVFAPGEPLKTEESEENSASESVCTSETEKPEEAEVADADKTEVEPAPAEGTSMPDDSSADTHPEATSAEVKPESAEEAVIEKAEDATAAEAAAEETKELQEKAEEAAAEETKELQEKAEEAAAEETKELQEKAEEPDQEPVSTVTTEPEPKESDAADKAEVEVSEKDEKGETPVMESESAGTGDETPVMESKSAGAGDETPVMESESAGTGDETPVMESEAAGTGDETLVMESESPGTEDDQTEAESTEKTKERTDGEVENAGAEEKEERTETEADAAAEETLPEDAGTPEKTEDD
nr:hypothetical protein BaRGS_017108 [Batillaria attramentaria]